MSGECSAPSSIPAHSSGSPARVLIVDDYPEFSENVADILKECCEERPPLCFRCTDLAEARELLTEYDFDLALLELHLTDGSGLQLLHEVRQKQPFMQVVFLTGDATVESAIQALEQGAFGYIIKPFRVQALIETTNQALSKARLLREHDALRTEIELSERRHRDIIDRVPAFVTALNEHGKIVLWNRQLESVTGFTPKEMLNQDGKGWADDSGTQKLRLKNGGHRSVRWKRAVVPESPGSPQITYAVGVDVTEESEMLRRTMRAERLAAVGTLAAGLAHEVRNPLNSATLQLQLMERRLVKGKTDAQTLRGIVSIVRSEIERLDSLVSEFLEFARPSPASPAPTKLEALIRDIAELVTEEAKANGVVINVNVAPDIGWVTLDPQTFRQVLLNLIRNGLDAMPDGGTLTLRARTLSMQASIEVEVEDTGQGFDTEQSVFDAFYTTKEKGTGLGLAIVHRIISEHGGTIEVQSEPGRTCFTMILPHPRSVEPDCPVL